MAVDTGTEVGVAGGDCSRCGMSNASGVHCLSDLPHHLLHHRLIILSPVFPIMPHILILHLLTFHRRPIALHNAAVGGTAHLRPVVTLFLLFLVVILHHHLPIPRPSSPFVSRHRPASASSTSSHPTFLQFRLTTFLSAELPTVSTAPGTSHCTTAMSSAEEWWWGVFRIAFHQLNSVRD